MTRRKLNTCAACSKPLERKTRPDGRPETPKQWAERKYCDRRCRDKAMTQAKNAPKTKTCPQCGKRYRQRPGEGPKRFQERRTCSRECAAKTRGHELTNAPPAPKPCEACGTTMRKKPDETPKVFRGRRFCSRKCAATLKKRTGNRTKVARIYEPDPTRVCPACNAGQRWADRQRQTVIRPHHEGGR